MSLNTWTWIAWLAASLVAIYSTRNPLYLGLIFLTLVFDYYAIFDPADEDRLFVNPIKFSLFIITTAAVFNALTSHVGDTVLFEIPGKLPLISGNVTLEGLIYGAINGLVLSTMLVTVSVINLSLPVRALIRMIPRAFYPVAIVTSIAVTFIPSTRVQFEQIREAQTIRGYRFKGMRSWLPMVMPLLVGGLERALQLSETMTARGFASSEEGILNVRMRMALLAGLCLILIGFGLTLYPPAGRLGMFLVAAGGGLSLGALWWVSKRTPRTSYKEEAWVWQDGLVILGAVITGIGYAVSLPSIDHQSLYYNPYPKLSAPTFDATLGLLTLGLLIPGVLSLVKKR